MLNTNPNEGDLGDGFITIPARRNPDPAPQSGSSATLDTGDTRFSAHVIEQGTNIWAVQAVDISGRTGIAWYRIDAASGDLLDNGTIADNSLSFYYPSIAVNETGDIVIGFSGSSPSTFAGDYAVTGTFNGTTTTLGSPQVIRAGTGPYFISDGSRNRWGDYSEVVLDPANHQTFWSVQEWASTVGSVSSSTWSTQLTAFGVQQTVTDVSSTTVNGTYGVGKTIAITVGFTNPVVVTGTPRLALNSGGTATYASGSGSSTLTFTYTVAAGQSANPLDEASTSALTLNGGTINDANSGVPAALGLPAPGSTHSLGKNKTIVISTSTTTTVTSVSSKTAAGSYGIGSSISVSVAFSNPVVITGTPQLTLNSGGTASFSSGSGTATLTFTYTVAAGQNANPLDEASTSGLTLNGGTINDKNSGVPAILTLPAPGAASSLSKSNIVVDTTAPTVTAVTSTTANGSYGIASVITVTVGWSEPVVVTGTPQLALNSSGKANYSSGSGTSTLTFTYTVAAGQNIAKLDYTSADCLELERRHNLRRGYHQPQCRRLDPAGARRRGLDRWIQVDRHRHHRTQRYRRHLNHCQRLLWHRLGHHDHRRLERACRCHRHTSTGAELKWQG